MNSSSRKHSLTIAVSLLFTLLTALATLGSTTFFSRTLQDFCQQQRSQDDGGVT